MAATMPPQNIETTYTFENQPRTIPKRNKYRESYMQNDVNAQSSYTNIMYDRRVVRGNTYSQHSFPPAPSAPQPAAPDRGGGGGYAGDISAAAGGDPRQQQQPSYRSGGKRNNVAAALRRRLADNAAGGRQALSAGADGEVGAEDADSCGAGGGNEWEEICDERVVVREAYNLADEIEARPASPLYMPANYTADQCSQTRPEDLFDFDMEVKPMLELLVGQTVEASLLEVEEEEALWAMREQRRAFEELRGAELTEAQRLREQDARRAAEKRRRAAQEAAVRRDAAETALKVAARAFSINYMADLVPSVFGTLAEQGYFYDPVERDVEQAFLPWLVDEAVADLGSVVAARTTLDGLLRAAVEARLREADEVEMRAAAAAEAAEAEAQIRAEAERIEAGEELEPTTFVVASAVSNETSAVADESYVAVEAYDTEPAENAAAEDETNENPQSAVDKEGYIPPVDDNEDTERGAVGDYQEEPQTNEADVEE